MVCLKFSFHFFVPHIDRIRFKLNHIKDGMEQKIELKTIEKHDW